MSEANASDSEVAPWLLPLDGDGGPCGPDLEYDNRFLELNQALAGKPETQFGPAEPPDWRSVRKIAEALMERTRDLRVAIGWLRARVHLDGLAALPAGLALLTGMVEDLWEHINPPLDDGDPYARVNALTLLREIDGLMGDLRATWVVRDRAIGELTVRQVEVARGLSPALEGEAEVSVDAVRRMLETVIAANPGPRDLVHEVRERARRLDASIQERLGSSDAPDLLPLLKLLDALVAVMPADEAGADDAEATDGAPAGTGGAAVAGQRGLSGGIGSRAEASRAIDMVCEFLDRTEPSNPAQLFLRRGQHMMNRNFLQLVKLLAPDALADVARIVGVDPDTLDEGDGA